MITIENLHHVSLAVTDLEKAKSFYQNVLCLNEIERPDFDFPGAWYQVGSQQLHLIVYPEASTLRGTEELTSKEGHFAFRVKSYEESLRWLKATGIDIHENYYSKSGFAQIFVSDPDGNLIELNIER
ncbi:VOC family protein [Bacillus sp. NTK071]|uniref:VOC family protein n=1 Tax=Bacillus sp. NTK071 TaxID=2802175 RepID=UPI001A8E99AA|nr:VOC family protein [Bacillus sp. NTK071]MBN8207278.1 VOC family protein [Bacillus sp. NTK071]